MIFYLNGEYLAAKNCKVSILDRGFKFGDGIFETISFKDREFFLLDEHIARLDQGLLELRINYDLKDLKTILANLLKKNSIANGSIRITITRGEVSYGYMPGINNKANIAIEIRAAQEIDYAPKAIIVSKYRKPSFNSYPTHVKTCQGLNSTLAVVEAREQGYFDALLLNEQNKITEVSSANVFWIKENKLYTPSLACSILPGIIRAHILKISALEALEVTAELSNLAELDYIFLTNSNYKIMPVSKIYVGDKVIAKSKADISYEKICELIGFCR